MQLGPDSTDDELDAVLPRAFAVVGQPDLPASRLARASALRVVMNVEGNFYPNVDYEACFRAGIHVLGCGPAYAEAVAEFALGLAIDLARGISREDRAFRAGRERYVAAGNDDAILLRRSDIGLVGYGNLGRALHALLRPFDATIRAFDPWLPASTLRDAGLVPATLDEVLDAQPGGVRPRDGHRRERAPAGRARARPAARRRAARAGRAGPPCSTTTRCSSGSRPAGSWPRSTSGRRSRCRRTTGRGRSRAWCSRRIAPAASREAFLEIGEMVLDDLDQVRRGLPPVRMQPAARELVGRYRSRPVS